MSKTTSAAKPEQNESLPVRKKRRWWIIIPSGLILLLMFLLIALFFLRDYIVERVICDVGSQVTGTPVTIERFRSHPFQGEIWLLGLKIANPPGYVAPYAVEINRLRVALQPGTLLKEKIIVNEVIIDGMQVNFEMHINGDNNLSQLQQNAEAFAATPPDEEIKRAGAEESIDEQPKPEKQLIIKIFKFENGTLSASTGLTDSTVALPMPSVMLTDIGEGKSIGETFANLFGELLIAVGKGLSAAGLTSENFKALGDTLVKSGSSLVNSAVEGGDSVRKEATDLWNNLSGIFKSAPQKQPQPQKK